MDEIDIALSGLFVQLYNQFKKEEKHYIPRGEVAKIVMGATYKSFVREGVLTPLEYLPVEEKVDLVAECRLTGENFTNETLIERSKTLHVIRKINQSINL